MDTTSSLAILRASIGDAFVRPGELLLSMLGELAPEFAVGIGIGSTDDHVILTLVFALLVYCLLCAALLALLRLIRNTARYLGAICRTLLFRTSHSLRGTRTRIVLWLRRYLPRHKEAGIEFAPAVDFDDLDLAVLRSASTRGPGFALSAPELAEQFPLRPAQIQRSLDKLSSNRMLDCVLGSTDGFETYRLSTLGAAFVANWRKQEGPR